VGEIGVSAEGGLGQLLRRDFTTEDTESTELGMESVTRIYRASGWAELTLPDILAAGAGDGFRRVLLLEGLPANRTIFLPHSLT
jgi:hypothetical protein